MKLIDLDIKNNDFDLLKELQNELNKKFKDEEIFLVGGCIRDILLGKDVNDYDLTGRILPEDFINIFGGSITEKMGTVFFNYKGLDLEYTPFRKEGDYNGRQPGKVSFSTNIKDDYIRRDFTINGLYYSLKSNKIYDFNNGYQDLQNKIIRTIGHPKDRFEEDYLRILRGIRFSYKYKFSIEQNTENYMKKYKEKLLNLSGFRIKQELEKGIIYEGYLEYLLNNGILELFFPIIKNMVGLDQRSTHHKFSLLEHSILVFQHYRKIRTNNIKYKGIYLLGAFFHDIGKIKQLKECGKFKPGSEEFRKAKSIFSHEKIGYGEIEGNLKNLNFSNDELLIINLIIFLHQSNLLFLDTINNEKSFEKLFRKTLSYLKTFYSEEYSYEFIFELLKISYADKKGVGTKRNMKEWYNICLEKIQKIKKEGEIPTINTININGHILQNLGFVGKEIGMVKQKCLNYVLENPSKNNEEDLISFVKESLFKR